MNCIVAQERNKENFSQRVDYKAKASMKSFTQYELLKLVAFNPFENQLSEHIFHLNSGFQRQKQCHKMFSFSTRKQLLCLFPLFNLETMAKNFNMNYNLSKSKLQFNLMQRFLLSICNLMKKFFTAFPGDSGKFEVATTMNLSIF